MDKSRLTLVLMAVFLMLSLLMSCDNESTKPDETDDLPTVGRPFFSPDGGIYNRPQQVRILTTTDDAIIHYTTDGSDPTESSRIYSSSISVSLDLTIKARAYRQGWNPSGIATARYEFTDAEQVATPTFSPPPGSYNSPQDISISTATPNALIYYTTDLSEPTLSSTQYTGPFRIELSCTIRARAYRSGWLESNIVDVYYSINTTGNVAEPTFSPPSGIYNSTQYVSLYTTTPGATIHYTTDGREPNEYCTEYTQPIEVSHTATIKARAYRSGWTPSDIVSSTYTIGGGVPGPMVFISGGVFIMGRTQGNGEDYELPTHSVSVSSFYMGKYEVTQAEYAHYMSANPYWSGYSGLGPHYPAYYISWYDALKYCNLRSIAEGFTPVYSILGSTNPADWGNVPGSENDTWDAVICNWNANGYRLPTEAEWEYAARGASAIPDYLYSGSDDISTVAWYSSNSGIKTHIVGTKLPNELSLCDMSGNVLEWCWDWFARSYYLQSPSSNPTGPASGAQRVLRGGHYDSLYNHCRVSYRDAYYPGSGLTAFGFRVCRSAF